jgi:low temperature requirement protein LtrA
VTALTAGDLTGRGLTRGMLVLALLWWCWVGYAWLGNVVRADEGIARAAMFGAMAAMFVLALSVSSTVRDLVIRFGLVFADAGEHDSGASRTACTYRVVK